MLRRILLTSFLAALMVSVCRAQGDAGPFFDVPVCDFEDEVELLMRIGPSAGASVQLQSGSFSAAERSFPDAKGSGAYGGLTFVTGLAAGVRAPLHLELMLGYETRRIESRVTDESAIILPQEGLVISKFQTVTTARLDRIVFSSSLNYYPLEWLYAGIGTTIGYAIAPTTQVTTTLLEPKSGTFEDGGRVRIGMEEKRNDASSATVDLISYVGAEFSLSRRTSVGLRVGYAFPVIESLPGMNLHAVRAGVDIRFRL